MRLHKYVVPTLLVTVSLAQCVYSRVNYSLIEANIPEDGRLNFTQLALKYGQKCEEHDVVTEDGYILTIFNIPGNKSRPILLMHGLLDSADTFIIRGKSSLAIALAADGYDVWFGNCRGNKYGRRHTSLDPDKDKKKFWDFSFHEFGVYDAPAMIDYVLNLTNLTKLPVIGHSQGNLMFYVLGSDRPEYNDKIEIMIALAPICHLNHVKGLSAVIAAVWPTISDFLALLGIEEIFRSDSIIPNGVTKVICTQSLGYDLCAKGGVFPVTGNDPDELEPEFFPVVIGHFPAGTSRKDADHQSQLASKKNFAHFDYGVVKNVIKYRSPLPPVYDLNKVSMPIGSFHDKCYRG
ncbi:lipase 1-like [Ostrinia nubilalis]|uniref:lipase 1-like n=1 Tax=Ostrinia nubilalis TaxID=29057 RepID=UPI003082678A